METKPHPLPMALPCSSPSCPERPQQARRQQRQEGQEFRAARRSVPRRPQSAQAEGARGVGPAPQLVPLSKCRLRLLKLDRIKHYLFMEEEELVAPQKRLRPTKEKTEEDRSKVDDLRGTPMSVGSLEEIIEESDAIVSSSGGPEHYVGILCFVYKDWLEPGCSILMHNNVRCSYCPWTDPSPSEFWSLDLHPGEASV